jgi:hypothetical protein
MLLSRHTFALQLGLLLFGLAVAAPENPSARQEKDRVNANAVYEAVVRYQIETWELNAKIYCIKINGKDASVEFLKALAPLPVKPASACGDHRSASEAELGWWTVVDKRSSKRAVIFDAGLMHWKSDTEVDVDGGYVCGTLCAGEGKYHVERHDSGWTVKNFVAEIMS